MNSSKFDEKTYSTTITRPFRVMNLNHFEIEWVPRRNHSKREILYYTFTDKFYSNSRNDVIKNENFCPWKPLCKYSSYKFLTSFVDVC